MRGRSPLDQRSQPTEGSLGPARSSSHGPTSPTDLAAALDAGDLSWSMRATSSLQTAAGNRAVQRLVEGQPRPDAGQDVAEGIDAAVGYGRPLDPKARERLEKGLRADLSAVRVHTDVTAAGLARSVGAKAFTTGSDIFFATGAYAPFSDEGFELLAHESTHTLQQARGDVAGTELPGGISLSDPTDHFEQHAAKEAEKVAAGRTADLGDSSGRSTSRSETPVQRGLWDDITDATSSAYNTAGDYAGGAYDTASEYAGEAADYVGEAAGGAYHTASEYAGEAADYVGEAAGGAYDTASEYAGMAGDFATDLSSGTYNKVINTGAEWVGNGKTALDTAVGLGEHVLPSNPYLKLAGDTLSLIGIGSDTAKGATEGQDVGEAALGGVGGWAGGEAVKRFLYGGKAHPLDLAINGADAVAKMMGAPQGVTDVTSTAADATPSKFGTAIGSNIGRGASNLYEGLTTGDYSGFDKQGQDILDGKSGGPLQGYGMAVDLIENVGNGDDVGDAVMKAGNHGQGTPLERIGSAAGDEAYKFINQDIPEVKEAYNSGYGMGDWLSDEWKRF